MENTEIMKEAMDTVIEDVVVDEVIAKPNNMKVVLKGGLIVTAVAVGAGLIWKGYNWVKGKKELRQPDKEIIVEAEDVAEVVAE